MCYLDMKVAAFLQSYIADVKAGHPVPDMQVVLSMMAQLLEHSAESLDLAVQ